VDYAADADYAAAAAAAASALVTLCMQSSLSFTHFLPILVLQSWYFHAVPYLLWSGPYPLLLKVTMVGLLELAFLTFPATPASSLILQAVHLLVLIQIRPPADIMEHTST
jgi:ALG3 protein